MKVLYLIPGSDYGDAEQKSLHLLTRLKELGVVDITVGCLYDNYIKNKLQPFGIPCLVFGGYAGLVRHLQTNHVDIIHFNSSKRLLQILNQNVPQYTKLIETIFNDGVPGDSTAVADRERVDYTIFDNQFLAQDNWSSNIDSIVQPHGINLSLLKKEDRGLLRSKYNIGNKTKTIGISCKSEELNISLVLQLAQMIKQQKSLLKIILFYSGSAKSIVANKIITLGLQDYLCIDSSDIVPLSFLDVYLDISDNQELRISTLEALCYRIPVVLKNNPNNQALIEARRVGFLYGNGDSADLISKYCVVAANLDRNSINLPSAYHVDGIVNTVTAAYKDLFEQVATITSRPPPIQLVEKSYYIIPYSIYGGAEVYLKNHIEKGTITNAHFLFLGPNQLYEEIKEKMECTVLQSLTELGNFLLSKQTKNVCFYNSANVYRLLARVKKISSIKITEIVHSYHSWHDSMHTTDRSLVDEFLVVSATVAKQWDLKKFKVMQPVINESKFKIAKVHQDKMIVGTVARLSAEKNLKRVIDIASLVNDDYRFIIVGKDGGCKAELEDYIKLKNLTSKVIIKDYNSDIEKEYATFDLFLLTSNIEGTPLTILEAQAAGIPVVAPDVGAIREMLRGTHSYVYPPNEPNQHIAQRISKMAKPRNSSPRPPIIQPIVPTPAILLTNILYSDENKNILEPIAPILLKSKPLAVRYK